MQEAGLQPSTVGGQPPRGTQGGPTVLAWAALKDTVAFLIKCLSLQLGADRTWKLLLNSANVSGTGRLGVLGGT